MLVGAAAGCCCRVPPRGAASVRFGACLLMLLQGVAAGCRCRVLQGAAIRAVCALWSCPVAGCRCRAPLQGAAVRVVYASVCALELACRCCYRVLLQVLSECGVLGCRSRASLLWNLGAVSALRDVHGNVGCWGLMEITFMQ